MLSITSDFRISTGCPGPDLKLISEAGFSHVHWCHHWNTDFLYAATEVQQIIDWFREYRLQLTDLHASAGVEKNWGSLREYERQAGVELVINRMDMCARLGGDVVIVHLPPELNEETTVARGWEQLFRSLDELQTPAREHGVRIALENGVFDRLERIFARYGPEYLGLCYDAGHGNMAPGSLDRLEACRDRLISVHLHDNDGQSDQHLPPFDGTVDWSRLTGIIAASAYAKWISMEAVMKNTGLEDRPFLERTFTAGQRLSTMITEAQGPL